MASSRQIFRNTACGVRKSIPSARTSPVNTGFGSVESDSTSGAACGPGGTVGGAPIDGISTGGGAPGISGGDPPGCCGNGNGGASGGEPGGVSGCAGAGGLSGGAPGGVSGVPGGT